MKVIAAMSGGVDSSVAAARLVDAGHEVVGIHLALAKSARTSGKQRGCCTLDDARDARRVADVLGIPFYVWDFSERFAEDVMADFLAEYRVGRTPNPCLRCNEHVKFSAVLDRARALGFDAVGTGHYARRVEGESGAELHRAADPLKDQSYVLSVLTAEQVAHSLFPLGDDIKETVREEAERRGLITANKPDSHDICFIPDGDTAGFLVDHLGARPGRVIDVATGDHVGDHRGTFTVTIGQRRGLDLRVPAEDGAPRYVVDVDVASGDVFVGSPDLLDVRVIEASNPIWCGPELGADSTQVMVQVRAHADPVPAQVRHDAGTVRVDVDEPIRGLAPGQTVAIYDQSRVVGSATIDSTDRITARSADVAMTL